MAKITPSLLCALVLAPAGLSAESTSPDQPVFSATDHLFDHSDSRTLGLKVIDSEKITIYRATDEGWTCNLDPSIEAFDGRLYAMWSNSLKDENGAGQRVLYSVSEDGLTWSKPEVLASPETVSLDASSFLHGSGWWVFDNKIYGLFGNRKNLWAVTSTDGRSWTKPHEFFQGDTTYFLHGPSQAGATYVLLGQDPRRDLAFYYSDTPGDPSRWTKAAIEGTELLGPGEWREPAVFTRPDGTLVTRIRSSWKSGGDNETMSAAESLDGGKTWRVTRTNFSDAIARAACGNLPNGTSYIVSNPGKPRDRRVLAISLSKDGRLFDRSYAIGIDPPPVNYPGRYKGTGLPGYQGPGAAILKDHLYVIAAASKDDIVVFRIPLSALSQ